MYDNAATMWFKSEADSVSMGESEAFTTGGSAGNLISAEPKDLIAK